MNEQKDMAGVMFANKNKTTDKHPDGTGKCMIDGVMYFMDSWNNTSANGVVYRAIKFKRMEKQEAQSPAPALRPQPARKPLPLDEDGSIPF